MEVLPKGGNELSPLDGGSAGGSKFGSRLPYRFSRLTFYDLSPSLEISLEEFEHFAIDRLRVLKGLEEAMSRGKKPEELGDLVEKLWEEYMRTPNASEALNKDLISHFVLRLVYCRTDELRRWFLQMETALFRYRFRMESRDAQKMFMEDCNLPYKAITREEVEVVKDYLDQVARSLNQSTRNSIYFKVPFEEVPELVAGRKVFLQKGNAFVPLNQITSLVVIHFRSRLSKALVLTNRKWTTTLAEKEKHRLGPILESLGSCYLGPDYSKPSDSLDISLKDIDKLANTSFPLCMRSLFYKLKEDHHLKHGGRMQLGLFLKGVGLKLEDALAFWRSEFSQKIGVERFDKEYAYSIRHNYGKEGKRMDYSPYSCQKIIMSTPGVGDHHGCPYRHFSEDNLRAALGRMGINGRSVDEIMDKVHERHYQIACTLTFEALHGCSCDTGINHPNQYFIESQKVLQAKNVGPDVAGTPTTPVKSESH